MTMSVRLFRSVLAGVVTLGGVGILSGLGWAVQVTQPRQVVVVVTHDLASGHRLTAMDVTLAAVPVGGDRGRNLLPASVVGLVPGEYLSRAVIGGAPLRDNQIYPAKSAIPALPEPAGAACAPSA